MVTKISDLIPPHGLTQGATTKMKNNGNDPMATDPDQQSRIDALIAKGASATKPASTRRTSCKNPDADRHKYEVAAAERAAEAKRRTNWARVGLPTLHASTTSDVDASAPWGKVYLATRAKIGNAALMGVYGPRGTGKTQLAAVLCKQVVGGNKTARYIRAIDLFAMIRDAQGNRRELAVVADFARCDLLIIDELHDRAGSDFEHRILNRIIDERYGEMLDTVLIANYTRAEFVEAIGPSIVSRMNECGGLIACDGPSFRGGGR